MEDPRGKQGYIFKEGAQFHTWKKRYLVIEQDRLSYYTNKNKQLKKGHILISDILVAPSTVPYKGKNCVFLQTPGCTYYIQESDDYNRNCWVMDILSLVCKAATPIENVVVEVKRAKMEDFRELKVISLADFGDVLLVEHKNTKELYTLKRLNRDTISRIDTFRDIWKECSVVTKVVHPFLAKVHWFFFTNSHLCYVRDFIKTEKLFQYLARENRFSEETAKFYAAELVCGVEYLHSVSFLACLKPENMFLSAQGHLILTDFGTHSMECLEVFRGIEYLAPEIAKGEEFLKEIDWWSVGALIYEMLTGLALFHCDDEKEMHHRIIYDPIDLSEHHFSAEAKDIMQCFLERDPHKRLQDTLEIKKHSWFQGIEWEKVYNIERGPPFVPQVLTEYDLSNMENTQELLNLPLHSQ